MVDKKIPLESELDYDKKSVLIKKRVISLRFRDYISQSGRRFNRKEKESALFMIIPIIIKFAKEKRIEILEKNYITERQLDRIAGEKFATPTEHPFGCILNFYSTSIETPNLKKASCGDHNFYFVEHFLDQKEKEFGMNYKYDFYKDIYLPSFVGLKEGIYKLERLSSLNKGEKISVSKLIISECTDLKGKNIFNEKNRIRLRFEEIKWANGQGRKYDARCIGRIVIRHNDNGKNYMFMGSSSCKLDTGAGQNNKGEKSLQIMSMQIEDKTNGEILKGIVLDTTGKDFVPFAARIRATFLAKNESKFRKKFLKNKNIKDEKDFFATRKYVKDEDSWFKDKNIGDAGDGLLSAF